ncbi:MAG: ABC transporter permease [Tannerellaceae bacterium]|nr:ABC transporter permease [Tannerellaceae bacterium]
MFTQIIKVIWSQRAGNAWIWAEIALVSVCLWYIVDDLYTRITLYASPLGYDITGVYAIDLRTITPENEQYRPQEEYGASLGDDLLTIVSRIRAYPGVEAVGISAASLPYTYARNYSHLRRVNYETGDTLPSGTMRNYFATPGYVNVFRYATQEGATDVLAGSLRPNYRIITSDAAGKMFPEGDATGKLMFYNDDSIGVYVAGVMNPIRFGDFDAYTPTYIRLLEESVIAAELNEFIFQGIDITLRAGPGADKDFAANFRKEMQTQLRYHNIYMLNIRSFADIRARYIRGDVNETKMYLAGVFFLLVNIFLGIVGTFFFRTERRLGEMGLRIALGSTASNLRTLLIGEGLLILLFAFIPAAVISLNLGMQEVTDVETMPFTATRFFLCQGIAFVLTALMITAGVWFPSRKVITLQPAEALRYE